MHNAAFAALGLDWRYFKLPVPPERFAETVRALPASGYAGANVTIPHKVAALELADDASAAARAVGAANTLTFTDSAIAADNTDAAGLLDSLGDLPRGRALVLGAGGAGRAAAWALREAGAEVMIWNRTGERAVEVARALGVEAVEEPRDVDLLVNATSVGLDPGTSEHEALEQLGLSTVDRRPSTVVDLVYREDGSTTPIAAWASHSGARVIDGLEVLVRQGALSFALWTGREAPLEVMREAARGSNPARPA